MKMSDMEYDLSPQALKLIASKLKLDSFYFITDWPASIKPFYVKPNSKFEAKSESFDSMFGPLEISSGSTRINRKLELVERMRKQGLNIQKFDYHLKVFDYGIPSSCGIRGGLRAVSYVYNRLGKYTRCLFISS